MHALFRLGWVSPRVGGLVAVGLGLLGLGGVGTVYGQVDPHASAIQRFVEMDRVTPPTLGGVVFTGSSTITNWNRRLAQDFQDYQVVGRGFGGSVIPQHLLYADRTVLPHAPRLVVFYCGENDISRGDSPQEVYENFVRFTELVFEALPETRILYLGMKPSPSRWHLQDKFDEGNGLIADFCARSFQLAYLDLKEAFLGADGLPRPELYVADRLHFSPAGYEILKALVEPTLAVGYRSTMGSVRASASARPPEATLGAEIPRGTILIDFGREDHLTPTVDGVSWNNFTAGGQSAPVGLVDRDNRATGAVLTAVVPFTGANASGTRAVRGLGGRYPETALRDSLYANVKRFGGGEKVRPVLRVDGLDPARRYELVFFASRTGAGDNRTAVYTVEGAAREVVELDAADNVERVAVTAPLRPAADGSVTISITPAAANNNEYHFTYLGVLEIRPTG